MGRKVPSPCVDVCKFKLNGHCLGCGMTKRQKKSFKKLDGKKKKRIFLRQLIDQQADIGLKANWLRSYRRKCDKKGIEFPLDA
ncbi:MAG: DUF1289 domain-containing protein [Pseudomonadota bacterium]